MDKFVTCINCVYAITWLNHDSLKCAVDCPSCGAKNQFGPDVYVPDFRGYTLNEVIRRKEIYRKERVI